MSVNSAAFMDELKQANRFLLCACAALDGFKQSKSQFSVVASTAANGAFEELLKLNDRMLENLTQTRRSDISRVNFIAPPRSLFDWIMSAEQALRLLVMGARNAALALIDVPIGSTSLGNRLKITDSQRRELLLALDKAFGDALKGGISARKSYVENAAVVLDEFLENSGWLPRSAK